MTCIERDSGARSQTCCGFLNQHLDIENKYIPVQTMSVHVHIYIYTYTYTYVCVCRDILTDII